MDLLIFGAICVVYLIGICIVLHYYTNKTKNNIFYILQDDTDGTIYGIYNNYIFAARDQEKLAKIFVKEAFAVDPAVSGLNPRTDKEWCLQQMMDILTVREYDYGINCLNYFKWRHI